MLIKVTMNNNDYTGIIENYFKRFIINYYYHLHKEYDNDAEKYVPLKINMEDILQKAIYKQKEMNENDYKIFELLKEEWQKSSSYSSEIKEILKDNFKFRLFFLLFEFFGLFFNRFSFFDFVRLVIQNVRFVNFLQCSSLNFVKNFVHKSENFGL